MESAVHSVSQGEQVQVADVMVGEESVAVAEVAVAYSKEVTIITMTKTAVEEYSVPMALEDC